MAKLFFLKWPHLMSPMGYMGETVYRSLKLSVKEQFRFAEKETEN